MVLVDQVEIVGEEEKRLKEDRERSRYWKRWYLAQSILSLPSSQFKGLVSVREAVGDRAGRLLVSARLSACPTEQSAANLILRDDGDAWSHFTHDHARSRAFRWGEDGIAGVCDSHGLQNIAFSFWNEKESVIRERCLSSSLTTDLGQ